MSVEFIPRETVSSLPVADVVLKSDNSVVTTSYQYEVKQPEEDKNDFIVEVKASKLKRVREKLELLTSDRFPLYELFLGISSTCLGAFLSALASDIQLTTRKGQFLFIFCPIVAMGTGVAYLFLRYISILKPKIIATDLLVEIVDPDKAIGKEI
ncbi:hypothetical protein BHU72_10730 [Desulfuribacillus stibiiarsenatis]|uniref:Uncharacterized protein n=1 Tax=Desulfuribacillus stibiiarsenatis TaxID=1390249 RepID=A0A1E5L2J6_9FIRM|nr:hypothetical protein [Desulfuribacillus stibiiarsenatis]OEH84281.1 hypothetical protein BHU72_10730 [Desulfuribacillus stibiiarsenatis]